MSYRNDFLEAFLARKKYIPDATSETYFSYKDLLSFNAKKDYDFALNFYENIESKFIEYYIPLRERNNDPIAHKCHNVAFDILEWCLKGKFCDPKDLAYTIGNVSLDGKELYAVTEESLKETIRKGRDVDNDVVVHAWLTYRANYVIDPTILFTLQDWGVNVKNFDLHPMQLWNESNKKMHWRLDYKPMLVDSDFFCRIDEVTEINM